MFLKLFISGFFVQSVFGQALIPFSYWGTKSSTSIQLRQAVDHQLWLSGTADRYISFATPPQAGSFVFLSVATWTGWVTNVYDNQGNTYFPAFSSPSSSCSARVIGWYAMNVNTGGTFTVTIVGGNIWAGHLREYSGVATTSALDQTAGSTNTGTTASSGNLTTTQNGELLIASQTHCVALTTSGGSGWTNHVVTTESQTYQALSTEDKINVPTGTYDATFGLSVSDVYSVGVASFKKQP